MKKNKVKKSKIIAYYCFVTMLLILSINVTRTSGSVLTIYPTDDVTLNDSNPTWRYGTGGSWGTNHYTGRHDDATPGQSRIYLKFDVSPIASLVPPTGYRLQVNSIAVLIAAKDIEGTGVSFDDALYAVADIIWTETTLPNGYLPVLGAQLATWTFDRYHFNYVSSNQLKSYVLAQASNLNKKAAFCIAESTFDTAHNRHSYYIGTNHGQWYGLGYIRLDIDYSFVTDTADLNTDGNINMKDIEILAQDWLRCIDPAKDECEKPWQ